MTQRNSQQKTLPTSNAKSMHLDSLTTGTVKSILQIQTTTSGRNGSSLSFTKKGLAYEAEVPVNWVEELGTAIANEEVLPDGTSERGGYPVVRKPMRQWMLKITAYAERLLNDLDDLDWPESIKDMQRNWIGKSTGANVTFKVKRNRQGIHCLYDTSRYSFWCDLHCFGS